MYGITINVSHIECETDKQHHTQTNYPKHADFIKNVICRTSQGDVAVLIVAADDGYMVQTSEHSLVCKVFLWTKHVHAIQSLLFAVWLAKFLCLPGSSL